MYKAYKFQLLPKPDQLDQLRSNAGAVRWLWNHMVSLNKTKYETEKKFVFRYDMSKLLPGLKKDYVWLKEQNSQSLNEKCIDLHNSLIKAIKTKSGFPKYKAKHTETDSYRVPQHFKISNKGLCLPKIGWVKWRVNRKLVGKAKSITIKQEGAKWFAVISVELPDVATRTSFHENEIVGLDVGLKDFVVTSDAEIVANPKFTKKSASKLARAQRILAKRTKTGKNRYKQKLQVRKIYKKITNQRKDFHFKTANSIAKNYAVVGLEKLNIKGMVKNRKLAKSISDVGWYSFKTKLKHKLQERGGLMLEVDTFYPSSKLCSNCGHKKTTLLLSERTYNCDQCNISLDRDYNAAVNIKNFAINETNRMGTIRIYACGDISIGSDGMSSDRYVSAKQENVSSMEDPVCSLGKQ